jgi:hypothetical protein
MTASQRESRGPGRRLFVDHLIRRLRAVGVRGGLRYDPERFELVVECDGGQPTRLRLAMPYAEYAAGRPADRADRLTPYVQTVLAIRRPSPALSRAEAMAALFPRVRWRGYYESTAGGLLGAGRPHPDLPWRPLTEHLAVGLVLDSPRFVTDVAADDLTAWDLAPDDAFVVALANLRGRSREPLVPEGHGVFASTWHDSHDASRLCLTEFVQACRVAGEPVAVALGPSALFVTGSNEPQRLGHLLTMVERHRDVPRVVSPVPVRLRGTEWVPLDLPSGHLEAHRLKAIRLRAAADGYQAQRGEVLRCRRENACEFVATFMDVRDLRTGEPTSFCTWSAGIPSLLPQAEWVAFVRPLGDRSYRQEAFGSWDWVRAVAGDLMTPVDCYPPRYRVEEFPSDGQLAQIGLSPSELPSFEPL